MPEFTINASEIIELVEAVNENIAPPAAMPVPKAKTFEDPAILSFGKRPAPRPSIPGQWASSAMERTDSARTAVARDQRALNDITPAATLVEPLRDISLAEIDAESTEAGIERQVLEELEAEAEAEPAAPVKAKRTRRQRGQRKKEAEPAKETTRSKGWRQTPLLEPNPSFQPFATLKKKPRRVDENGWATEDATDVQDMGDFDFEGSLAKFDKHTVFNQFKAEDSVADEDRLVAHNRLPKAKPGTAGGKNLHYTENVLDGVNGTVKLKTELWKSEAGESEDGDRASQRGSGNGSGRLSRRQERAESKLSLNRRPVSRKGSNHVAIPPARNLQVRRIPPFKNCFTN